MAYKGCGGDFPFPIIADEKRELAVQLGMLDPDEKTKEGLPLTCRAVCTVDTITILFVEDEYAAAIENIFNLKLFICFSFFFIIEAK